MSKFNSRRYNRRCERHTAHEVLHDCCEIARRLIGPLNRSQLYLNQDLLTQEDKVR